MTYSRSSTPRMAARWAAVKAWQQHHGDLRAAAAAIKKPLVFVQTWVERYINTGNVADSVRSGRPRLLSDAQQAAAVTLVEQHQSVPVATTALKQQGLLTATTSHRTVARAVKKELDLATVQQQPPLSANCKQKRKVFSRLQLVPGELVSIDSSYFTLHGLEKRRKRWVKKGQKAIASKPNKSQQVHVYAALTAHGKTDLVRVTGTTGHPKAYYNSKGKMSGVGAQEFQEVMEEQLIPVVNSIAVASGVSEFTWLIDNAPAHTAKATKRLLANKRIKRIIWPPHSPDLMPIENAWAWTKRKVYSHHHTTLDELWAAVQAAWASMPASMCRALMESVPRRQQLCLERDGGHTGY